MSESPVFARLHAIDTERIGGSHREHDRRHYAFEVEAGGELPLQIIEVHVVVLGRADASISSRKAEATR